MGTADRNALPVIQYDLSMMKTGDCMQIYEKASVAAYKKGRKLLLKFTEFISGGIGFISGINKSFPQITLQIQNIICRNSELSLLYLKGKILFPAGVQIFQRSMQGICQIIIQPVFVNEVGMLR